ncbi:hypothetical protein [Methanoregula formicica]|uniref:Uncharacterized protein n=1 Tax=Methanoregula formicica (strain DSM 22288 / NBRC 105244 / SMSP) TaxID=593750 RepID=L0HEW1_METFS|nr:hypothetical protein [Methanoregula formicica]AGB01634.1 hypothetical protein Metfor_0571 [Methanoregula formicica SMSP]
MRRAFCTCLLLVLLLVFASGCTQPVAPVPPQTTALPAPVTPLPVATTTIAEKSLTFDVFKTQKIVNITYTGGPDAGGLVALKVRIDNQDLDDFERTVLTPSPGESIVFTYQGLATPVTANIIGTWENGYQQTVLMYYF